MKWVYDDGGRSKYFKGTTGDCVTRAISIATGRDYKEIYDLINKYAKEEPVDELYMSNARTGVCKELVHKVLADLGWTWKACMFFGKGCQVHLKDGELPKKGVLIVSVSKHLTCIKNNVIHDTYDPSRGGRRCVYGYFVKS
ncbi:MAG: hypothetical protein K2L98_04120 [Bacilli bacterium]|nr:hypothetical protein [Bacilli bacterium]